MILLHPYNPGPRGQQTMISVASRSGGRGQETLPALTAPDPGPGGGWSVRLMRCVITGHWSEQVVTMSGECQVWCDAVLISK